MALVDRRMGGVEDEALPFHIRFFSALKDFFHATRAGFEFCQHRYLE